MSDYPFGTGEMLYRLTFYLASTFALFGIFFMWRSSRWKGPLWRHLFEILNIAGFAALFLALWFLCGISSMDIEEIRPAIAPLVFGGYLLALLSYLIYFRKLWGSLSGPPQSVAPPSGAPEDRSG